MTHVQNPLSFSSGELQAIPVVNVIMLLLWATSKGEMHKPRRAFAIAGLVTLAVLILVGVIILAIIIAVEME